MSEPSSAPSPKQDEKNVAMSRLPQETHDEHPRSQEDDEDLKLSATSPSDTLSPEHRDYLLERHGTLDLNPLPSADPVDPLNWSKIKKNINLALLAANGLLAIFTASSIIPAFVTLSKVLDESVQNITYLTASQIAVHAVAPLLLEPISNRIGRRPTWIIGTLMGVVFNIACAQCKTYGSMMICRLFSAFAVSPSLALGPAVVSEMFFVRERPPRVGIWTLFVTLGPPFGPFVMGFVAQRVSYVWIYYVLAIFNGILFFGFVLLYPETRYFRDVPQSGSEFKRQYLTFGVDRSPYKAIEFYGALTLFKNSRVILTTGAWAVTFVFPVVLMTVEIPTIFTPYGFGSQQIGLQFIGNIIGALLGELSGSPFTNFWVNRYTKKHGTRPRPEYRLWSVYGPFVLVIIGMIVFGVTLQENRPPHPYNVAPIVGVAIANFGNQIVTTILFSYLIDCYPSKPSQVGVCMNLIRSTWAFLGPFWFPDMFKALGYASSGGLMAGLVAAAGVLPIILVQYKGGDWRGNPENETM